MQKTLKEIAGLIAGDLEGEGATVITGVSGIKEATAGDITFLANPKYYPLLEKTLASAVIVPRDTQTDFKPIVRVENSSLAFTKVVSLFSPSEIRQPKGIHPSAVLGKNVKLGVDVSVGPCAVVEDEAEIGDRTVIYAGCFIGAQAKVGTDASIYPNVSIRERVTIGSRAIIHSGTVIGSDGFGFVTVEGRHQKIPQTGTVEIGDDVEIGANVSIDRARFGKTVIGSGTKIDNLVQIAHNVVIGENSIIVAQAGISGSTTLGKNVILAGQVGVVGHIHIADNAVIMAQSGVSKSVPENSVMWGYPAKPVNVAKRVNACVQGLPRLYNTIGEMKKKIEELRSRITESKNG